MTKQKTFSHTLTKITDKLTMWVGTPTSIILHTFFFIGIFGLLGLGISLDKILLILTTAVSLEAIYLALFIQMTVNKNTESLEDVEENIDEIQEDVEGLEKDVDQIQEDVEDVEQDIDKLQEEDKEEDIHEQKEIKTFTTIELQLTKLAREIELIQKELQLLKRIPTKN